MNKAWDAPWKGIEAKDMTDTQKFQAWSVGWLTECLRVLKPGGIIKVFGATRMFHRMAAAMEEAGFFLPPGESLEAWSYGSGFPKYLNTSKAIDESQGHPPEDSPITDDAKKFDGWATALKPAWEPFVVGVKKAA